jgi:hypothetical protein
MLFLHETTINRKLGDNFAENASENYEEMEISRGSSHIHMLEGRSAGI